MGTIEISTPIASGVSNPGDPQALSIRVKIASPRSRSVRFAAATIAGTSCTSKVKLPGLSMKIARVLARSRCAIAPPVRGS